MSLLDELLNAKARAEEFTPDIPRLIIAGSKTAYKLWAARNCPDSMPDPVWGPRIEEVPMLGPNVFAIETQYHLLVLNIVTEKAMRIDLTKLGVKGMITFDDKVAAIYTAKRIMEEQT